MKSLSTHQVVDQGTLGSKADFHWGPESGKSGDSRFQIPGVADFHQYAELRICGV